MTRSVPSVGREQSNCRRGAEPFREALQLPNGQDE